jgi:hypothetical protein
MRRALFIALLLAASMAQAQELDIFDINDFVDPRDLGATITPRGWLACPCQRLLVSRLMAGGVADYVDVLRPTNADLLFAHLATSYYTGRWQLNFKATRFDSSGVGGEVPAWKYGVQAGRYFTMGGGNNPATLRAQVNASKTEYRRQLGPTKAFGSVYDTEIGFEVDTSVSILGRPFVTSLVFLQDRPAGELRDGSPPFERRRLTLLHRLPRLTLAGMKIDASIAGGMYQFKFPAPASTPNVTPDAYLNKPSPTRWAKATVLPALELTTPSIPKLDLRFHVRYEPIVQQMPRNAAGGQGWQTTQQIALFIDRAVFAKSF